MSESKRTRKVTAEIWSPPDQMGQAVVHMPRNPSKAVQDFLGQGDLDLGRNIYRQLRQKLLDERVAVMAEGMRIVR